MVKVEVVELTQEVAAVLGEQKLLLLVLVALVV
jgi:hypothetical protein